MTFSLARYCACVRCRTRRRRAGPLQEQLRRRHPEMLAHRVLKSSKDSFIFCRNYLGLTPQKGLTLIIVNKFLTEKGYFGQNLGFCLVLIFRPMVRKWLFFGKWVKGVTLIRGSVQVEG